MSRGFIIICVRGCLSQLMREAEVSYFQGGIF
jgi:hypothetical protein